jgi:hypothetical protein
VCKWIRTALLALPLIAAGGLVYAHSGNGEASLSEDENANCPLQTWIGWCPGNEKDHSMGVRPTCPLQRLLNHASPSTVEGAACPLQRLFNHLPL